MVVNLKKTIFSVLTLAVLVLGMLATPVHTYAAESANVETATEVVEENSSSDVGNKALAAGLAVGLAAAFGAIGMGISNAKANEGISRQPEAEGKIRSSMMLGLVFIETAIIYALIVAILIIFVM